MDGCRPIGCPLNLHVIAAADPERLGPVDAAAAFELKLEMFGLVGAGWGADASQGCENDAAIATRHGFRARSVCRRICLRCRIAYTARVVTRTAARRLVYGAISIGRRPLTANSCRPVA